MFAEINVVSGVALFVVLVGLLIMVVASLHRDAEAFKTSFPPISDAEFVASCTPGTNPEVALKVRRIVAEHFAIEYDRIHPDMSFIEDLGVD